MDIYQYLCVTLAKLLYCLGNGYHLPFINYCRQMIYQSETELL